MSLLGNQSSKAAETAPKAKAKAQEIGEIGKKKASEQRLALRIEPDKREEFKLACMRKGTNMSDVLLAYIDKYIAEN
nr:plasmid partition protein ParG [Pseudomonas juntendi]